MKIYFTEPESTENNRRTIEEQSRVSRYPLACLALGPGYSLDVLPLSPGDPRHHTFS